MSVKIGDNNVNNVVNVKNLYFSETSQLSTSALMTCQLFFNCQCHFWHVSVIHIIVIFCLNFCDFFGFFQPKKGILIPLCQAGDTCTLREAAIICACLREHSIPPLHAAAGLLKIAEMDYNGVNSLFLRVLLEKKYALVSRISKLRFSFFDILAVSSFGRFGISLFEVSTGKTTATGTLASVNASFCLDIRSRYQ